jgi:hypothetical protein
LGFDAELNELFFVTAITGSTDDAVGGETPHPIMWARSAEFTTDAGASDPEPDAKRPPTRAESAR